MPDQIHEILSRVVPHILEGAAFVFTDDLPPEQRPPTSEWSAQGVRLTFEGPISGDLRLWAEKSFMIVLAANMLGIEPDDENAEAKAEDALKETLNMIVGTFLTDAYGNEPVFHLGIPESIDATLLSESVADPLNVWLNAEDHPVLFSLHLQANG